MVVTYLDICHCVVNNQQNLDGFSSTPASQILVMPAWLSACRRMVPTVAVLPFLSLLSDRLLLLPLTPPVTDRWGWPKQIHLFRSGGLGVGWGGGASSLFQAVLEFVGENLFWGVKWDWGMKTCFCVILV